MPPVSGGMKCPLCGAPTEVIDTRLKGNKYVRKRECFNEHRFKTIESPVTIPKLKLTAKGKL